MRARRPRLQTLLPQLSLAKQGPAGSDQDRGSARDALMVEPKSGSWVRPSPAARSARTRAGQLLIIPATAGSGAQSISALASGPATRSSAATMPATVTVRAGRLTA